MSGHADTAPVLSSDVVDRLRSFDGRQILFLFGSARSGTTWAQRLIAHHRRVRTGQESGVFGDYLAPMLERFDSEIARRTDPSLSARQGVGLGAYLDEADVIDAARFVVAKMVDAAGRGDDEWFLEKSPQHARHTHHIARVLPAARMVFVHRDPRDTIGSILVAGGSWGKDWASNRPAGAVRKWRSAVQGLLRARRDLPPGRLLEVCYEDLCHDPRSVLGRVWEFMDLPFDATELDAACEANARAAPAAPTEIPLRGIYGRRIGPVVREPDGFVGGSGSGRGWTSLSRIKRAIVWRHAHRIADRIGYPAEFARWVWNDAPAERGPTSMPRAAVPTSMPLAAVATPSPPGPGEKR